MQGALQSFVSEIMVKYRKNNLTFQNRIKK
jgi:hypothetical protein